MSLITTRKRQAAAASAAARERARQAAEQLGPVAKSARENAAQRVHATRRWAAPRIQQAAHSVQENVAPKVSAALEATAQKIEPAPDQVRKLGRRARGRARATSREVRARQKKILAKTGKPSRRWPKVMGGIAFGLATAGAIMTVMRRRNGSSLSEAPGTPAGDETRPTPAEAEAGSDGQVRTS